MNHVLLSEKTFKSLNLLPKLFATLLLPLFFSESRAALYSFSGNASLNGINGPIQKCEAKWIGQAMIYPSSGFNGGAGFGSITTVGFHLAGSGTSLNIPFKVYLKSVGATTTLTGTPTWATALSGATLVFSGNTPSSFAAGNWYDITLGTPFNWASGNLEVLVECDWAQVTGCGTTPVWAYNIAANTDQQWLNNTSAASLQTTAGEAVDQYRPDIRLNVSAPPSPPTVTSFNPTSACAGSGASVVITGTGFTGASAVSFNGTPATYTVNSDIQITATLPAGTTTGTISVTTSGGTGTSLSSFTVNPLPTNPGNPASNSPQCVSPGVTVTATGSAPGGETWYWQTSANGTNTANSGSTYTATTSGTIYIRSQNNNTGCWSAGAGSISVTITAIPAQPGTISGLNSICSGSTNSYSVSAVSGATSYSWTLPNGWSGTSTTTSINTAAGGAGGNITVTANNTCGNSSAQTITVNVVSVPTTPGAITGPDSLCSSSPGFFSVAAVNGATSYTWTLPNGWSGTSTTNSISATAGSTGGTISVIATGTCGGSGAQTHIVSISSASPALGVISGPLNVCTGSVNTYSVTATGGASSYTWTLPNGWSGSSTGNSINATSGVTGGDISVVANSTCGSSSPQTLTVSTISIPSTPGTISGPAFVCSGSTNSYSVVSVSDATSYTWTLHGGWSGSSSTETISATANTAAGNILVTANNTCGSSVAQDLNVSIETAPAIPGTITGPNSICDGSSGSYSVGTVSGATGYTWTLPVGWSGNSSAESINATSGATGGSISVTADNNCGSSSAQTMNVTVNQLPQVSFDFTQNPICQNASPITITGSPVGGTYTGQGVSGTSFNPTTLSAGNYVITYSYTDGNGCSASDTSAISVTICSGLNTVDANNIEIYPNPFNSKLTINLNGEFEKGIITLYDVTEKELTRFDISTGTKNIHIDTSGLAKGVYLLDIITDGKTLAVKKVIRLE